YLMIFFLMMFSFSITKSDKTKSRKYEESLANIQKSFGGKTDAKRLDRAKAQENESRMEDNLKESMAAGGISSLVQIQSNARMVKLVLTEGGAFCIR
ncbi:MAG: hypothetical protein KKH28_07075, partial [Elusimicrobia bacterium]|nr:hypothetical protein [Elusimicrobiota bacterium]